ncbi:MAG: hypothetical protein IV085_06455 [Thiobacillus sp.]|nr:hypothetical protein [Thiobacillus sp.]
MRLLMDNLFAVVSIALAVAGVATLLLVTRYRRMRMNARQLESARALEQDAVKLASAKLKFRNILARQGQPIPIDPLRDLYGVDVPTDCQPG